jgi:AcrR family transcriptional regulator
MKTVERILSTALVMFNQQNESNISSVDIALALNMSPGNLYYHFKGKKKLVYSLFNHYKVKINHLLNAPFTKKKESISMDYLTIEDFFYYLLMMFKIDDDYCFLYQNPTEMIERYPLLSKDFKRILKQKESIIAFCLESFYHKKKLSLPPSEHLKMSALIGFIGSQMPHYQHLKSSNLKTKPLKNQYINIQELKNHSTHNESFIYHSLSQVLFILTPYLSMRQSAYEMLQENIDELCKDAL